MISSFIEEVKTFGLRISRYRAAKVFIDLTERREIGEIRSHRSVLTRDIAARKNSGKKGPSQGVFQQSEPHERGLSAPKFEDETQEETLQQTMRQ